MGVINVTPDSFSGDGLAGDVDAAVRQAAEFVEAGVDFFDVGGESTRPGAEPVPAEEEIQRTVPVIVRLRAKFPTPISIDTSHAATARAALEAGAHLVNDITGLRGDPDMAAVVAGFGVPVVLMHIQGTPRTMQQNPTYDDVVEDVRTYLQESIALATAAGIARDRIIVDPGIGFGKTVAHNLQILRRLGELRTLGCPVLVGTSRKSFLGKILDRPVTDRLEGTAASVAIAIAHGADLVRVHDVKEMVRVVRVADAIVRGVWGTWQDKF
jgi:dihydropteroate synthase